MAAGSRRPRSRRLPVFVVAVGIGVASAFVATRLGNGDEQSVSSDGGSLVAPGDVGHVHGVGLNPADGRWYIATHAGVLRAEGDGSLLRVADRYQDTMGFTVVDSDEFLASGHPDLRDGLPSRLGLIRSTDAGLTWVPVSLSGDADLHAIVPAGDLLYAADASNAVLLVSPDAGVTWERRAAAELMSLAADPSDPQKLVGITYDGATIRSEDGGRSFASVPGPALASVVWTDAPHAADAAGSVYALGDSGWTPIGDVGGAEPVLGVGGDLIAAALPDGSVRVSADGGRSWGQTTG